MRTTRKPPLTISQILAWADAHLARTGEWPRALSGHVLDNRNEKWQNVNQALVHGYRGLPGGDTLAALIVRRLGVRNLASAPRLTRRMILRWADAHRRQPRASL